MELSGEHRFSAPRERVYDFLLDPDTLQACLPGCEKLEQVGEDEYSATMKIGIGMIRGTFTGKVKISDKQEPSSYKMLVEGRGPQGQVSGEGSLELTEDGDGTIVHWSGDANVRGTLARIGSRVIKPAATTIVGQFFDCLESRATATQQA
ncbi:MAG TPA: carbon monoxide dehydrogenase subunit G [Thermomicrobiales bacterium]|nr:carbon monoxide dehydrogenase subunit G [Thermomicrobiales bacterium]